MTPGQMLVVPGMVIWIGSCRRVSSDFARRNQNGPDTFLTTSSKSFHLRRVCWTCLAEMGGGVGWERWLRT